VQVRRHSVYSLRYQSALDLAASDSGKAGLLHMSICYVLSVTLYHKLPLYVFFCW